MNESDGIPETVAHEPPADYTDTSEEIPFEPSATKGIPDDIIIPPENQTGGLEPRGEEQTTPIPEEEVIVYKSIWPPLVMTFIFGTIVGSLVILTPLGQVTGNIPNVIQQQFNPTDQTDSQESKDYKTQIIINKGFGRGGSSIARDLAVSRIQGAKTNIIWITNFPNDPAILAALKEKSGIPTLIITGNDANRANSELANRQKLGILRAEQTLEDSEGYLIIDNNYVIDIGRSQTVWETIDAQVVEKISDWVSELLKTAQPR